LVLTEVDELGYRCMAGKGEACEKSCFISYTEPRRMEGVTREGYRQILAQSDPAPPARRIGGVRMTRSRTSLIQKLRIRRRLALRRKGVLSEISYG